MHSKAEEEVLYRPLRRRINDKRLIEISFDDHDEIDKLIMKLQMSSAHSDKWMENVRRLRKVLIKHIELEEGELFEHAQEAFSDMEAEDMAIHLLEEKSKFAMPNPVMVAARKVKELVSGD